MFWGLMLKSNKKYTQQVPKAFHLSHAALDTSTAGDGDVQVLLTQDNITHLLCTLRKNVNNQCQLNLEFEEGEKLTLCCNGTGTVHLTGYHISDMGMDSDEDGEFDLSDLKEQDLRDVLSKKKNKNQKIEKETNGGDDDDEEDSDDSDFDLENDAIVANSDSDDDDDDAEDGADDDDDDDDDSDDEEEEDDDEEEEMVEEPKAKKQKVVGKEKPKVNGIDHKLTKEQKQKATKNDPKTKQEKQKNKNEDSNKKAKKVIQGGVIIEDLVVGNGTEAKSGKKVVVYYEGRLKENNKVFDSSKSGPGFKFQLGRGEVIGGWDVGLAGMKVGSKRRITCPPKMAYGPKGQPPVIPPNSTLVFDVELRNVL